MITAYFDCFSGAAGDMILAALLDAGCPESVLHELITRLKLPGVTLSTERVNRGGIAATHVQVRIDANAPRKHRHLKHILEIISAAQLPEQVATDATRVFIRLADAEASVHGTSPEKVHFHEVGADDAIVDIVGACAAIAALNVDTVISSPIPTGFGSITCEHGVMPVPAPATARLLTGVPLAESDEPGELTTPTGAAILTTLATRFGPLPSLTIRSIGYGAGTRPGKTRPNVLRVLLGDERGEDDADSAEVVVLEAQVDDATGQAVAFAIERLLATGALDAFIVPIIMKKGRPGQLLTVLARPVDVAALEAVLFAETTTFGVRRSRCDRSTLTRRHVTVATRFGPIRVKLGSRAAQELQAWPEFEDCAAAARKAGAPLRVVQETALRALREHDAAGRNPP